MAQRRRPALRAPKRSARAPAAPPKPLLYTAQDVARFCEVDLKTVHHWADRGKVPCFRTEGRHLRFRRNDVVRFLRAHSYPLPGELVHVRPSIVIGGSAGAWPIAPEDVAKKLSTRFVVRRCASGLAAVARVHADGPDAIVVTMEDPSLAGARSIAALKEDAPWLVIAVIGDEVGAALAAASGAEVALLVADVGRLGQELARALATS
jgi:excisionase family DNA binding protein